MERRQFSIRRLARTALVPMALWVFSGCQSVHKSEEVLAQTNMGREKEMMSMPDYVVGPPDLERATLDPQALGKLEDELGDVLLVLLTLGQRLDIDLLEVAERKLRKNAEKYAVETSRGRSDPAC